MPDISTRFRARLESKQIREFIKFFLVGFSAFLIDFSLLFILVYVFDFRNELFGYVLIANVISSIAAVLYGFYFQKKWTFRKTNTKTAKREFILFAGLQAFNVIVYNGLIFNAFVKLSAIPIPISKILVVGLQMVTSFLSMKFIIFTNKEPRE